MKIGAISGSSATGYVPMQDRILSSLISAVRRASKTGKTEVVQVLRDSPALEKAVEALKELYDVQLERSNKVKVTIKL